MKKILCIVFAGLVTMAVSASTLSAQSGPQSSSGKPVKCEANGPNAQECVVIIQTFANSTFSSAPFNFAPFGFSNPEPSSCLVQLDPCPANQTVPVHNVSATGANASTYTGQGNAGKFIGHGITQSVVTFPLKPCRLDDGTPGFETHLIAHIASTHFESGDMLFEHGGLNALLSCVDFATGRFDARGTVDIIGGFGKFEGAQGTQTVEEHGQSMVFPGAANTTGTLPPYNADGTFGVWHGSFVATFTVPKN